MDNLIGIALNPWIALGSRALYTLIYQVFQSKDTGYFSIFYELFFTSLVRFILKYFIFDAIIKGIVYNPFLIFYFECIMLMLKCVNVHYSI